MKMSLIGTFIGIKICNACLTASGVSKKFLGGKFNEIFEFEKKSENIGELTLCLILKKFVKMSFA